MVLTSRRERLLGRAAGRIVSRVRRSRRNIFVFAVVTRALRPLTMVNRWLSMAVCRMRWAWKRTMKAQDNLLVPNPSRNQA